MSNEDKPDARKIHIAMTSLSMLIGAVVCMIRPDSEDAAKREGEALIKRCFDLIRDGKNPTVSDFTHEQFAKWLGQCTRIIADYAEGKQ